MQFVRDFKNILFVDVETTGLHSNDRVVSLGAILVSGGEAQVGRLVYKTLHTIFDPMRKSHPRAEAVHGFDDWTLRHQEPFTKRAKLVHMMLDYADLVVAHNAEFDLRFIRRELMLAGFEPPDRRFYCTMHGYRERFEGAASLSSICARIGAQRLGSVHGALEDAWLAMQIFFWLNDCDLYKISFSTLPTQAIQNFIAPPPRPEGTLPKRKKQTKIAEFAEN